MGGEGEPTAAEAAPETLMTDLAVLEREEAKGEDPNKDPNVKVGTSDGFLVSSRPRSVTSPSLCLPYQISRPLVVGSGCAQVFHLDGNITVSVDVDGGDLLQAFRSAAAFVAVVCGCPAPHANE